MRENIRDILFQMDMDRRQAMRPYFTRIGLTVGQGQPRTLDALLACGPMNQRELAEKCRMDVTTMSRTLDRMAAAGLILREENKDCRRSYRIVLTRDGEAMAKKVREGFLAMNRLMEDGFSEEELETLRAYLIRIRDNIRGKEGILDGEPASQGGNKDAI